MPAGRKWKLAKGRNLRFVGLNSALVCSHDDNKGTLLLGQRQWPIPQEVNEEVVVLIHHPLDWLQDSAGSRQYIMNRARVLITGHEHNPSLAVKALDGGGDLLLLAAGATAPPANETNVTYTYNILEFAWDAHDDVLAVTVHPRTWNNEHKAFASDDARLGGRERIVKLRRRPPLTRDAPLAPPSLPLAPLAMEPHAAGTENLLRLEDDMNSETDDYPILRLRFFRELTPRQRLNVLVSLDALPADLREPVTHVVERRALDSLKQQGRLSELAQTIDAEVAVNQVKRNSA